MPRQAGASHISFLSQFLDIGYFSQIVFRNDSADPGSLGAKAAGICAVVFIPEIAITHFS